MQHKNQKRRKLNDSIKQYSSSERHDLILQTLLTLGIEMNLAYDLEEPNQLLLCIFKDQYSSIIPLFNAIEKKLLPESFRLFILEILSEPVTPLAVETFDYNRDFLEESGGSCLLDEESGGSCLLDTEMIDPWNFLF